MLVDGKSLAKKIMQDVSLKVEALSESPRLAVITSAPNFETKRYLEMKQTKAASAGIVLNVVELPEDVTTEQMISCVETMAQQSNGLIVQLPLPAQVDKDQVLDAIPPDKDADGFKYSEIDGVPMSPVVSAIDEISIAYGVEWKDKNVVVIGQGRLVGLPAAYYAGNQGANLSVLTEDNFDEELIRSADIIITGAGKPALVTPDMVKDGVVVFDAGTSEDGGELVGDVAREVDAKASLMTPVPGGIGPMTIACLLRNLASLAGDESRSV